MFRSEDMVFCQLYLQPSATYSCLAELGEVGLVQFKDLNAHQNSFNKKFVSDVRRCEEMERRMRYLEQQLVADNAVLQDLTAYPKTPSQTDLQDLEAQLEAVENQLRESTSTLAQLDENRLDMAEMREVMRHLDDFMRQADISDIQLENMSTGEQEETRTGYVTGTVPFKRMNAFMKTLYFATYGQTIVKFTELESSALGLPPSADKKAAFIVFYHGNTLEERVEKIISCYSGRKFAITQQVAERAVTLTDLERRMADMDTVLDRSRGDRREILQQVHRNLRDWQVKVLKAKAIFHTMNMLHTEGSGYIGECWLPAADFGTVQVLLNHVSDSIGVTTHAMLHPLATAETPPTYFRLNKFTRPYQAIINAYGVATYKEVNPALYALISFPFLFGVMFGDLGHGIIMFLFALWMCIYEEKIEKAAKASDMFSMIYGGRYVILLMGGFAIYAGFMYNECFAKGMHIFPVGWNITYDEKTLASQEFLTLDPNDTQVFPGTPYPFGVDPTWAISTNKITFANSYKEKLSVILGVAQMVFGISLSLFNHIHFNRPVNVILGFLPELVFLLSLFGYLVGLIIAKWIVFTAYDSSCAPSLLVGYINMFLLSYPTQPCYVTTWYNAQKFLELCLVLTALLCALVLLFGKPLFKRYKHRRRQFAHFRLHEDDIVSDLTSTPAGSSIQQGGAGDAANMIKTEGTNGSVGGQGTGEEGREPAQNSQEEFNFGEVMINQAIHAIEFCLGCISHTASYLRLWALSLAHSELSEVLWVMVFRIGLNVEGWLGCVMLVLLFPAFAVLTIAILLIMEGLSAFLHTLRLHWIEFQSKFYTGEGIPFHPFNFRVIIEDD